MRVVKDRVEGLNTPESVAQLCQPRVVDPWITATQVPGDENGPIPERGRKRTIDGRDYSLGRDAPPGEEIEDGTVAPDALKGTSRREITSYPRRPAGASQEVNRLLSFLVDGVQGRDLAAVLPLQVTCKLPMCGGISRLDDGARSEVGGRDPFRLLQIAFQSDHAAVDPQPGAHRRWALRQVERGRPW
jgi:hypothetical protein